MPDTMNDDVAGFYNRCNRYMEEATKAQSSGVADINEFDKERLTSYVHSLEKYVDWVVGQPQLDLPETHPLQRALPEPGAPPNVQNLMIVDWCRLIERGRDELVNSQSSRNATGLIDFDERRCRAVLAKTRAFIKEYVDVVAPLDVPESSPQVPSTGRGFTGV